MIEAVVDYADDTWDDAKLAEVEAYLRDLLKQD